MSKNKIISTARVTNYTFLQTYMKGENV